ncbi:MAG: hypothetical protein QW042_05015 [Thermoplasmata archaeon]
MIKLILRDKDTNKLLNIETDFLEIYDLFIAVYEEILDDDGHCCDYYIAKYYFNDYEVIKLEGMHNEKKEKNNN